MPTFTILAMFLKIFLIEGVHNQKAILIVAALSLVFSLFVLLICWVMWAKDLFKEVSRLDSNLKKGLFTADIGGDIQYLKKYVLNYWEESYNPNYYWSEEKMIFSQLYQWVEEVVVFLLFFNMVEKETIKTLFYENKKDNEVELNVMQKITVALWYKNLKDQNENKHRNAITETVKQQKALEKINAMFKEN